MPPKWPRQPTRRDPAYRKLEDRINFAVHVAAFLFVNSGCWFAARVRQAEWPWLLWLTLGSAVLLVGHFIYIAAIADYSPVVPGGSTDGRS